MNGDRKRGGERTAVSGAQAAERDLPELQFTEVNRSKEPIVETEEKETIEAIAPWHDYTVISVQGESDIQIINEQGDKIALAERKLVFHLEAEIGHARKKYLGDGS